MLPYAKDDVHKIHLFSHLSKEEFDTIYANFTVVTYKAGDLIISEGEIGDRLYIIVDGSVRVFTYNRDGEEIVLSRLEKGNYFGEQALLDVAPTRRNANVKAITDVCLLMLSHKDFQSCLKRSPQLDKLLNEYGAQQLIQNLLKKLDEQGSNQKELSSLFNHVKTFEKREVIFRQNDPTDFAYYLLSGMIEIRIFDNNLHVTSHSIVTPGHFFGELGVLRNAPRAGMAVALRDCQVAAINAEQLQTIHLKNVALNELLNTSLQLYDIPLLGLITQYQTTFLGKPAITSLIHLQNDEAITATRVISADIFSICYVDCKNTNTFSYQDSDEHIRHFILEDNRLVGVISIGKWDDLEVICKAVYSKQLISQQDLMAFEKNGKLISQPQITKRSMVCECMRVPSKKIEKLIEEGITKIEDISRLTGAATVCGGCRPSILELLGTDVWAFVTVKEIKKHNDYIHTFQLHPGNEKFVAPKPGQHIVIEGNIDNNWISRSYTLTSTDNVKYYEITVKREDKGLFSRWLFDSSIPHKTMRVSAPQGDFIIEDEKKTPILCFLGGIGITPGIAFARHIAANGHKRLLHIDYSVHNSVDIAFENDINDLQTTFPNIIFNIRLTKKHGRIDEQHIQALLSKYEHADIYICGPKPYESAIMNTLTSLGVSVERIHTEQFTHAGGPLP